MITSLLSIPVELIVEILARVCPQDLIHFQLICHFMHDLIQNDSQLQYRIALFSTGMVEVSRGNLSPEECFHILRQREQAWRGLRWRKSVGINLPECAVGHHYQLFQLDDGILNAIYVGAEDSRVVRTILPSSEDCASAEGNSGVDWEVHPIGYWVEDIYVDVSQDLLVLVEFVFETPFCYKVHLRTLSSNLPHSDALHPILVWQMESVINFHAAPGLTIQVAGNHIGIRFATGGLLHGREFINLWNWRTGCTIDIPHPAEIHRSSFIFLRDDTILFSAISKPIEQSSSAIEEVPCTLQVYMIARDSCSVRHAVSYHLPTPDLSAFFESISVMNTRPVQSVCSKASTRIYSSDPNQSITVFHLYILPRDLNYMRGMWYTLFVETKFLVSDAIKRLSSDGTPILVPWHDWGVRATRMLPSSSWKSAVYGARYATLSPLQSKLTVYTFITISRPKGLEGEEAIRVDGTDVVSETVLEESIIESPLFAHPVRTSLPYHKVTTNTVLDWDAIVMDEERIVGRKDVLSIVRANIMIM